jgi:hypothetical protein
MMVHEFRKLRTAVVAQSVGSTVFSPISDAAMYRMEVPKHFVIPSYNHDHPPVWIGTGLGDDAVLPQPLVYDGTTESDLVQAIYPVLDEILSTCAIKLVNSETDVFLPVPELLDEADLYNKPDLHLIHPALYRQSKHNVNSMVFGKPDVKCLNGIIALLEAKLPPLSDTQVGVLMRYLTYWFANVKRNVSGIVFNKTEFVYCVITDGIFNPANFIRCRWDAAGSKGLIKRLLVDLAIKPTEAMVIGALCTALNVRLSAEPGTSYLGRGAEATVLRVTEIGGAEVERALKYYHAGEHNKQCQTMCTRTSDLIRRVSSASDLVIAHVGVAISVCVDAQYNASGVLIEKVGRPVTAKGFGSGLKKATLFAHLRALHILGIVHGDARIQNIVDLGVGNSTALRWIDLGRNLELTAELAVADFVTMLESYRGTKFASLDRNIFQAYASDPANEPEYTDMVVKMLALLI